MSGNKERFIDGNLRLSAFMDEVWVVCPVCSKKAIAFRITDRDCVRMSCISCGYARELSTKTVNGMSILIPAHAYFNAVLWLQMPFRKHLFQAFNGSHLAYLEQYIAADIRESRDRTHFTLLEKLPKFYHAAENRVGLLKIIAKLREK
jgi:hypothetical protein